MSALDLIPSRNKPFNKNSRDDLRLIEYAETLGYEISFKDGNWVNSAAFTIGYTTIWFSRKGGWCSKDLIVGTDGDVRFEEQARIFGAGYTNLKVALETEATASKERAKSQKPIPTAFEVGCPRWSRPAGRSLTFLGRYGDLDLYHRNDKPIAALLVRYDEHNVDVIGADIAQHHSTLREAKRRATILNLPLCGQ